MEQQYQSVQQEVKLKAPIFVKIIAWIVLLSGIGSLLFPVLLLLGGLNGRLVFGAVNELTLIQGLILIVVSFGIRYMRRWALYTFTGLTALTIVASIYFFQTLPAYDPDFKGIGIQVLILIYLWSISKKFT